jgi:hypothetical protein
MEPFKILVIIVLFAIPGSRGSPLFHMSRGLRPNDSEQTNAQAMEDHS